MSELPYQRGDVDVSDRIGARAAAALALAEHQAVVGRAPTADGDITRRLQCRGRAVGRSGMRVFWGGVECVLDGDGDEEGKRGK